MVYLPVTPQLPWRAFDLAGAKNVAQMRGDAPDLGTQAGKTEL
jgi:hypothetical protein